MFVYPLHLHLSGLLCTVVGGGEVGLRKVAGLLAAGARVRLVATELKGPLPSGVEHLARAYRPGDLAGARLAFAATDDPQTNAAVVSEARAGGILVSRADRPEEGDFSLPAVLRRGDLTLSVGTAGGSPALAALLRDQLAGEWSREAELFLEVAASLRRKRLTLQKNLAYNSRILRLLAERGLPGLLAAGEEDGADRLLAEVVGDGVTLKSLGIRPSKGLP